MPLFRCYKEYSRQCKFVRGFQIAPPLLMVHQAGFISEAVRRLLRLVRPNAVALVDAFEYPDNVLNSAIGRHDGRVYEALYEVRA